MSVYFECAKHPGCGEYSVDVGDYCGTCYEEYENDRPLPSGLSRLKKEIAQLQTKLAENEARVRRLEAGIRPSKIHN